MAGYLRIDRELSRSRIAADVDELSGPSFTRSDSAICRYAYTPEYRRTVRWFAERFEQLGFAVREDPVGTLVAQNQPPGVPVFGIGSHCDSNRHGGRWDGTLGVVVALEVCRLAHSHGLRVPLRAISFLEEEGSGFGQMLLGSRICAQRVNEDDLRTSFRAVDDQRSFWQHAVEAGHNPSRWRECAAVLDDLVGWIECHIEQGRVLQDASHRLGFVDAIAGYVHADVDLIGRADHAGSTPMSARVDAMAAAAEVTLELERLATEAGRGTVGAVGELELEPGLISVIPGHARLSLDIRGVDNAVFRGVAREIAVFAEQVARRRGGRSSYQERQSAPPTPMSQPIIHALEAAAIAAGESFSRLSSGAAHDTVCVADRAPCAMVFIPCRDGISHAPEEDSDPADAALACEVILNAIAILTAQTQR